MKQTAERIFRETLAAIDISATVERKLAPSGSTIYAGDAAIDLREFDTILAIAFGKASFAMAQGIDPRSGSRFFCGRDSCWTRCAAERTVRMGDFHGRASNPECDELCGGPSDSRSAGEMR